MTEIRPTRDATWWNLRREEIHLRAARIQKRNPTLSAWDALLVSAITFEIHGFTMISPTVRL